MKLAEKIETAFRNNQVFSGGNTNISVTGSEVEMRVHGNLIAKKISGVVSITDCGYKTSLTSNRLNLIDGVELRRRSGNWVLNGESWDGSWIEIK